MVHLRGAGAIRGASSYAAGVARLLVLGCGYAGTAVARLARARGASVVTNVRSDANAASLRAEGFDVLQRSALDASVAEHVDAATHVVVAFPPDGETDARLAPALARAAAVTYVSSTGVYGEHRGVVDAATPLPVSPNARAARLLAAEDAYLAQRATVLRCPALYGRDRGLHVRVLRGAHQIPGDGTRYLSRIHVDDLAQLVLASVGVTERETLLVGDLEPAPHVEVVRFICETYGVPMPPFVPLESVHESLRADRRVDGAPALARLGVTLLYPTYREGLAPSATGLAVRPAGG
jgi:nucleoside-diphosphate-sugar epimerase